MFNSSLLPVATLLAYTVLDGPGMLGFKVSHLMIYTWYKSFKIFLRINSLYTVISNCLPPH